MNSSISNFLNDSGLSKTASSVGGGISKAASSPMAGGLLGGAISGGLISVLLGSKKSRKTAGKVATYGGAAFLGGLAYKAFSNWTNSKNREPVGEASMTHQHHATHMNPPTPHKLTQPVGDTDEHLELVMLDAMIGAAKSDGQIDDDEHKKIFKAINEMGLTDSQRAKFLEAFAKNHSPEEIASRVSEFSHSCDVYLAARLAIDPDQSSEKLYLKRLSDAMGLPNELVRQLEMQAEAI